MDKSTIPKWLDVKNAYHMDCLLYFANPASKFGVAPTKKYWKWVTNGTHRSNDSDN
jgi:hypothetical protein